MTFRDFNSKSPDVPVVKVIVFDGFLMLRKNLHVSEVPIPVFYHYGSIFVINEIEVEEMPEIGI